MRPLLVLCLCLVAPLSRADDRPYFGGECHPPVLGVIDVDWRRDALRFREQSLRAFARHEGEEGARRQLRAALELAEATRVSAYDVIQLTRELLLRGLRGKELDTARAAALDAQATFGAEGATRFLRGLGALHGRATVTEADLKEIDELLGRPLVREALGRRLGGKGDADALRALGETRLQAGVDGAAATGAVLEALLRLVGHAQPGEAARAAQRACVVAMSRSCPRKEAEEHCRSTPREYLELMQKGP